MDRTGWTSPRGADGARAGRSYDARRDLYVDIFAYFHRLKLLMARTEPFVVPAAGPHPVPDMPSEEDGIRLGAMTSALGSSELNAAVDACLAASRQWRASVGIYRCVKVQLGDTDQQTVTARMATHTFSERYDEKVGELELLVRGELGSAT